MPCSLIFTRRGSDLEASAAVWPAERIVAFGRVGKPMLAPSAQVVKMRVYVQINGF
jgi:hypothetical protein